PELYVLGDLTLNSSSTWTKSTTQPVTWSSWASGTSNWTDNNATKQDLGAVVFDNGLNDKKVTLTTSVKATSVSIGSGHTLNLGSSGYTLTLTGSGTGSNRPLINSGTFTAGTSTVQYTGA